jgi:inorganic phosphate transporter, PiT family
MDLTTLWVLGLLIAVALAFDFMNGFHDGANSVATIVATGAMSPKMAVLFAAAFNFLALWVFELKVAATIGKGTVAPAYVDHYVIFGALMGALIWNIITWYYGIPSSSSHALIGGLVGAVLGRVYLAQFVVMKDGSVLSPVVWGDFTKGLWRTISFIVISPLVGFLIGGLLMVLVAWIFRSWMPAKVNKVFNVFQIIASGFYSLSHGGNDAQKTIGIIWLLLISAGISTTDVKTLPTWVVLSCYTAIAWGTYYGGWRIIKTMGSKITKLNPMSGSCAALAGSISLGMANMMGIPVSTTHTISGSIVGVGAAKRMNAVRWGVAGRLMWAWVITIPASALMGALFWWVGTLILAGIKVQGGA